MAKATGSIIVAANPNTAGATIFVDDGQGTSMSKVTFRATTGTGAPSVFSRGADVGNDINLGLRFSTSTTNTRPKLFMRFGGTGTSWQYSSFEDDWGLDGDRPAKLVISDTVGSKISITFSTGTSGTSGSAIFTGTNSVARKVSTGVYEVNGNVASNASGYRMFAIGKCIQDAIDNDSFDIGWEIQNGSSANYNKSSSDGNLSYYVLYLFSPNGSDVGSEHSGIAVGLERASGTWTASSGTDFMTVSYDDASSAFSGTSRMASIDGPNEASYAFNVGSYKSTDNNVALSTAELANEIKNLINALPIAITATVSDSTVSLTNDAHGTDGNVSITTNDSTNFSVSGMSGGSAEGGGGGGGTSIMARSRIGSKLLAIGGISKDNLSSGSVDLTHLNFQISSSSEHITSLSDTDIIAVGPNSGSVRAVTLNSLKSYISSSVLTDVTASGNTILGTEGSNSGSIAVYNKFTTGLLPKTDNANDLGGASNQWKDLYINGIAYIDQLGTDADPSNAYIGGGEIDGTTIGSETPAAGTFTALVANGNVDLGDATSDTITATGRFDSALVPSTHEARDLGSEALSWNVIYAKSGSFNGSVGVQGGLEVGGDFLPKTDSASDLGSSSKQWAEAHIDTGYIDVITASYARITSLDVDEIVSRTVTKESLEIKDNLIIAAVSASQDAGSQFIGGGFQLGGTVGIEGTGSNPLFSLSLGTRTTSSNAMIVNVGGQAGASFVSGSGNIAANQHLPGMRFGVTGSISGSLIQAKRIEAGHLDLRGRISTAGVITLDNMATGSVQTPQLGALSVTHAKIAVGAVTIDNLATGSVQTPQILDGAVTHAKLAVGAVTIDNLATGSVQTAQVLDGAITHAKLAVGAATVDNLATGSVQTPQLGALSVTHAKIAVGAVTIDNLATGSVQTPQILDGAVTHAKLAVGAATVDNLATGSVQTAQVLDLAITHGKLAVGAVNHDNVASGSIEGAHLSDKVILNTSDAHGGLVLSSNKLSVGFRKVAFVRADGSNISGSTPTKGMFADKAVPTPYTTASLSAECQSGSLMVYLNGVLLHGDHPGQNAHGPTSADFRLATASNDYKVLLNEDLALDADDILTVTYLSGALS